MKRFFISISLFCIGLNALADVVSSSKAYDVAQQFMNAAILTEVWDGNEDETETKAPRDPFFHVFNVEGGGWVIVSGEDCTVPILGYSDSGSFNKDGIPSNMHWWLGLMREDIRQARQNGQKGSGDTQKMWANPGRRETKADTSTKTIETASWDQEAPYNNLLSSYVKRKNGQGVENLCTGCVATAMAEVLRYHKWPEHGSGTLPGYTTFSAKYSVIGFSIDDHYYDWDNMPLTYDGNPTSVQANAVAQLMLDCGVMVEMDYGTSSAGGSGALTTDVVPALTKYMQYSKLAELKMRSDYSNQEWLQMIKYDIDNCGPIIYGGFTRNNEGHQFVCDGYDLGNSMIHINWGWSGSSNGWFTLTLSIPNMYTFNNSQTAVFGLVPDKEGSTEYPDVEITLEAISDEGSIDGLAIESGTFASGGTFSLSAGKFVNNSLSYCFTGAIKAVLVDKHRIWKEDISDVIEMVDEEYTDGLGPGYYFWFEGEEALECTVNGQLSLGDRIAFWYRLNDGSWTPVVYDRTDLSHPWELAYVDACFIKKEASYRNGDPFNFELIPGNKGISSVAWSFDGTPVSVASVTLSSGTHTIAASLSFSDGTAETITQEIVVE
ncbi:MAG: C10 family peptidase [Bacteroidales bacterium]|nr:C10 family peptidase [Bacteroidales bacterium]MBR5073089.1 C10 family peptidase [Bacteroidales bacterium]